MSRTTFRVGILWRLIIALILALCLVPISSNSVFAISLSDYFLITRDVELSKTQIVGSEVFYATIEVEATCINDVWFSPSEAEITGSIIAVHQTSGTRVTLNSSYTVTINDFPSQVGQTSQASEVVTLRFPVGSQSGTYSVIGELIEASVKVPILGWVPLTNFVPQSSLPPPQTVGSVTYTSDSGGGSSGDGGGGGGGGGVPPGFKGLLPKSTTELASMMNNGVMVIRVDAASGDGLIRLIITKGTKGLRKSGKDLNRITIGEIREPPALPEQAIFIGRVYDFTPDDTIFDPPITFTFKYDPDEIPEGVNEEDLFIVRWDETSSKWIRLEGTVDTQDNVITTKIDHFSGYAILADTRPAALTASSLSITPTEIYVGESANISVVVTNTGYFAASKEINFKIDNVVVTSRELTLEGGATQKVTFTTSGDIAGTYTVTIGGLSGTFVVRGPVAFITSDLSITPAEVDVGEGITISALITNTGNVTSSYKATLKIDGVVITTREVTLEGGATQKVTFTTSSDVAGTHAVTVDGPSGTFVVRRPAAFVTSDLSITPAEVDIGEGVTISALVTNTGDVAGSHKATLSIDNVMVTTREITLEGGATQKVTFTTSSDVAGTYTADVNGLSGTFTVTVKMPPVPELTNWQPIGGIIAAVVIAGLIITLFFARRRRGAHKGSPSTR